MHTQFSVNNVTETAAEVRKGEAFLESVTRMRGGGGLMPNDHFLFMMMVCCNSHLSINQTWSIKVL